MLSILTMVLIHNVKQTREYRQSFDRYLELLETLPDTVIYEEKIGYISPDTAFCHVRITNMPYDADTTIFFQTDEAVYRKFEIDSWVKWKDREFRNKIYEL